MKPPGWPAAAPSVSVAHSTGAAAQHQAPRRRKDGSSQAKVRRRGGTGRGQTRPARDEPPATGARATPIQSDSDTARDVTHHRNDVTPPAVNTGLWRGGDVISGTVTSRAGRHKAARCTAGWEGGQERKDAANRSALTDRACWAGAGTGRPQRAYLHLRNDDKVD